MPQLDALTYFSQFVYLLISFVTIYIFVLSTIIPKVVSAQKLRQKMNSAAYFAELNAADVVPTAECVGLEQSMKPKEDLPASLARASSWEESAKQEDIWPTSARALQMCHTLVFKKRLCTLSLVPPSG